MSSSDRRDEIVAELAENESDGGEDAASEPGSKGSREGATRRAGLLNRRDQVVLELRGLRAKAEADRKLRAEVLCCLEYMANRMWR